MNFCILTTSKLEEIENRSSVERATINIYCRHSSTPLLLNLFNAKNSKAFTIVHVNTFTDLPWNFELSE